MKLSRQCRFALVVAVVSLLLCGGIARVVLRPALHLASADLDLGEVYFDSKAQASLLISNDGFMPLVVNEVKTSCGCVLPRELKLPLTLDRGESCSIMLEYTATRTLGPFVKDILISTNDRRHPLARVSLNGNVVRDVQIHPEFFSFAAIKDGDEHTAQIRLTLVEPTKVVSIGVPDESWRVTSRDLSPGEFELSLSRKFSRERNGDASSLAPPRAVVVRTTSKRDPVLEIPIVAHVTPLIEVQPASILHRASDGPLERKVVLAYRLNELQKPPEIDFSESASISGERLETVRSNDHVSETWVFRSKPLDANDKIARDKIKWKSLCINGAEIQSSLSVFQIP